MGVTAKGDPFTGSVLELSVMGQSFRLQEGFPIKDFMLGNIHDLRVWIQRNEQPMEF